MELVENYEFLILFLSLSEVNDGRSFNRIFFMGIFLSILSSVGKK